MLDLESHFTDMMLGITQSEAYKDFMSFIDMLGSFNPAYSTTTLISPLTELALLIAELTPLSPNSNSFPDPSNLSINQ
jgi:hypothetical protein